MMVTAATQKVEQVRSRMLLQAAVAAGPQGLPLETNRKRSLVSPVPDLESSKISLNRRDR